MIEGHCHCGDVRISVPAPPAELTECNCSLCSRTGALMGFFRPDQVDVRDEGGQLRGYVQGDATLTNWHCGRCGCTTHWSPRDPDIRRMGVNIRLFDRAIWEALPRTHVDGASW